MNRAARRAAARAALPSPPARPLRTVDSDNNSAPVKHLLPVIAEQYRSDAESYIAALSGIRMDNFLDGLVGGHHAGHTGGGWKNHTTGHGTFQRDKVMQGHYDEPFRLSDPELSALFNGNDLAQRICMDRPLEAMRRGWCLVIPEDDAPEDGDGSPQDPDAVTGHLQQPMGGESGAAAPGSPLVDVFGADPRNAGAKGNPDATAQQVNTQPKVSPSAPGAKLAGSPSTINNPDADAPDVLKRNAAKPSQGSPNASAPASPPGGGAGQPPAGTDNPITAESNFKSTDPSQETFEGPKGNVPPPLGTGAPEGKARDQSTGADLANQLEEYGAKLSLKARFLESKIFGRLYGGGLLIVGADDGQDMSTPLQEDKIKTIRYLSWMDRRFIFASSWYTQIGPKFGEVETWEIVNPFGGQSNTRVHETRVVRFDGTPVDFLMRRRLLGWSLSVLQAPYDVLRQFDLSFQSIANLMADVSQAVLKMNGLAQMISNDPDTLQTRMALVDISRSTARMLYLDAENEEFERTVTPTQGISDIMEMQMLRVSAAAKEPVSRLFGRQPSGLNATGDADIRQYYDQIKGEQKTEDEPKLRRLYTLLALAKDSPLGGKLPQYGLQFTWHKLYEPSELEQSTIRWNMAQADDKYVANGTLLPEEVATSRFRDGDLHLDTEIDLELRRESLETAQLAPSGAEKAQQDQENKEAELKIAATSATAKGGPPGKPGAGKPPAKPGARTDAAEPSAWEEARYDSAAEDVYDCMSEDFPPDAIDWVHEQDWRGPTRVALSTIDYSNRKKWHASKPSEHGRVSNFAQMLEDGKTVKPIILVQPPKGKAIIVDGHHRALAHRMAGKNKALVYVAKVPVQNGPWDETHAKQRSGLSGESGASGDVKERGDEYPKGE